MMRRKKRVIRLDPERARMVREAWDLLLTGNHGLEAICEELHNRGYTRRSGKPWVWNDEATGALRNANSQLNRIFHTPFYAGWVVSPKFGIKRGDVRGYWEPLVTDQEFDEGLAILRERDEGKSRNMRRIYLLSGLVAMRLVNGGISADFRMHGAAPKGRSRHYTYYTTHLKINGKRYNVPTLVVEEQVEEFLSDFGVNPLSVSRLREIYNADIQRINGPGIEAQTKQLRDRLRKLREEETALGRLFVQGRLTNAAYDRLYQEWRVKVYQVEQSIHTVEHDYRETRSDLDTALALLECAPRLYPRMDTRHRWKLLQIIIKRIIIDSQGNILEIILKNPFTYLRKIAETIVQSESTNSNGSDSINFSAGSRLNYRCS